MKRTLLILAALSLTAGPVLAKTIANPPTAAQKAKFYAECFATSQNETLCACKANAAMTLVDAAFMDVVIAAMHDGGTLDPKYNTAYIKYIQGSTKACGMGAI